MSITSLAFPGVILVMMTSVVLVISQNWRWSIAFLAVQYLGVFILAAVRWPVEIAVAKLVAGWMSSAVLGIAVSETIIANPGNWRAAEHTWPSSRIFRLLAASLVGLTVASLAPKAVQWLPGSDPDQIMGGLALLGMGLLHLGLTAQPLRVTIGLLTITAGFEIIYASLETSTLVAGLLAAVNLAIALVGAYLLIAPNLEEAE